MYRALYRKWRPRRFEDVVGQEAIVTALQNQIAAERIGHAYLFTGTRGTGKTTCAKIFAKAVNCLDRSSPDPCCQCEICKGIDDGTVLDVSEIDAASNNSVDDIRTLRDETAFLPSVCQYKVFIIDEVHMLSASAFNALLKTMEEPPSHVIFILATTEVQKVPVTILSRCQRYDFTRITPDKIAGRLKYVAGEEKIDLTEGAAGLIARLADGAMRDALSILDTCAGVSATVDEELVRRMAGVTDRGYLFEISDAIAEKNAVKALEKIAELRQQSVDMRRLCVELTGHYRNLMLSALPGGTSLLSGIAPEEEQAYARRGSLPQAEAVRAINAFGVALEKMARGTDQRIELELAIFSLTQEPILVPVVAPQQAASAAPVPGRAFASAPAPFAASSAPFAAVPPQPAAPAAPVPPAAPMAPASTSAATPLPVAPGAEPAEIPPPSEQDMPPFPLDGPELAPAPAPPPMPAAPPVAPPTPTPAVARPKKAARQPVEPGELRPFAEWPQVQAYFKENTPMFDAYLRDSRAFFDGRRVLIECTDAFRDFMRQKKDTTKELKKILLQVTGEHYNIGPYEATTESADPAAVPIEETLQAMQNLGVDVVVDEK